MLSRPKGILAIAPLTGAGKVRLSLVVPTYNESQNIATVMRGLKTALGDQEGTYEIIVVDDDSPDKTWEIATEIGRRDPQVRVLHRLGERGLATAVVRGWQVARGEVLGVIDGDLQHPPELISRLWNEIKRGAEIAIASRRVIGGGFGHWSIWRRIFSLIAQLLGLILLPKVLGKVSDPMSGYFMVRRSLLEGIHLNPKGCKILIEVLGRCRATRIAEVGYIFRVREHGNSKATLGVFWEYLVHLVRLRFASRCAWPVSANSVTVNPTQATAGTDAVDKASTASADVR
ncbi:MAG: polyprenol monophosphomannose synthase [Candidatus Korobacteraceae bacterium]|jgi:dolichol-phosphate mannosyltransferase